MVRIRMHTTGWCGYCVRAKALLGRRGVSYEEISLDEAAGFRELLLERTGSLTVPQIVIDGEPIGGYAELSELACAGGLDELVA